MSRALPSDKKELAIWSIGMWETLFWIQTAQVGVGILSLPRMISEAAEHSGWMAIPIAGLVVQLALWMMVVLMRRFDPLDLYDILRLLFGKFVGNLLGFLFAFYCLTACGLVVRTYVEVVQTWLFPTTSTPVFYWLLVVPVVYLGLTNPRVLGRFSIIAFLSTIWMTLLMIIPIREIDYGYYLPIFDITASSLFQAALATAHSVSGFEVLLVFYPFIQNKKKALKIMSVGIWFTISIYLFVTLIAFGFYSQGQLQTIILPTVHMLQIVQLPMIERIEHIGIAVWSFLVVSTAASYTWAGGRFIRNWERLQKYTPWLLMAPLTILAIWPREVFELQNLSLIFGYTGGSIALFLPPLLLLTAKIRGKKGAPDQTPEEERKAS